MVTYNKPGFGNKYFKIVKNVLAVLFGIFALFIIVSFFLESDYRIEKKIVTNAEFDQVEQLVVNPSNWLKWSVWNEEEDSTVVFSYEGPESGKDAVMHFEGELLGNGSLKIDNYEDNSIDYKMSFADDAFHFKGKINFISKGEQTEITWIVDGNVGWNPFAKYFRETIKRFIAQDIQANLENLKEYAEQN